MIIWTMLITHVVMNLAWLTFNERNKAMTDAAKQVAREIGANSAPLAVVTYIAGVAVPVLWTVYAFAENDWRFAAIGWAPAAAKFAGWLLSKRWEPQTFTNARLLDRR